MVLEMEEVGEGWRWRGSGRSFVLLITEELHTGVSNHSVLLKVHNMSVFSNNDQILLLYVEKSHFFV